MSNVKKPNKLSKYLNSVPSNGGVAKSLSIVAVLSTFAVLALGIYGASLPRYEVNTSRYVYLNLTFMFSMIQMVSILFVSSFQKGIYWVIKFKNMHLDERQIRVRQRVFEKAYVIAAACIFLLVSWIVNYLGQIDLSNGALNVIFLPTAFVLFGLPSILAAWEKDS